MKPTLLVLAAGIGSRYGGLKQIDPVGPGGEIVIDYSIYDALRAGFEKIVFVIRRDIEAPFKETIGRRFEGRADIRYVYQELASLPPPHTVPAERKKPWGTAHAILTAAEAIREPFGAINADDFYGAESYRILHGFLARAADAEPAEYAMVGYTLRNTLSPHGAVARGVCEADELGHLRRIVEIEKLERDGSGARSTDASGRTIRLSGDEIVSMNLWGFTPSVFGHLARQFLEFLQQRGQDPKAEFFIPTVVDRLIAEGRARVSVLRTGGSWFGVTYREDKEQVRQSVLKLVDSGVYPRQLWG